MIHGKQETKKPYLAGGVEIVRVQLSKEGGKVAVLEIFRQNVQGKLGHFAHNYGCAISTPRYHVLLNLIMKAKGSKETHKPRSPGIPKYHII